MLVELEAKFNQLITPVDGVTEGIPDIKKIVFDDLSAINADSQDDYPLALIKPPVSSSKQDDRALQYSFCDMDVFMFAEQLTNESDPWTATYDKAFKLMRKMLQGLFTSQPKYVLVGECKITPGHMQHNGKLIACRAQFKLRIFNEC